MFRRVFRRGGHRTAVRGNPMTSLFTTVDEICGSDGREGLPGWCTPVKGRWLAEQVITHRLTRCVEIGVFGGRSLLSLALGVKHLDQGGFVLGLDPYDHPHQVEGVDLVDHITWSASVPFQSIYLRAVAEIQTRGLGGVCGILRTSATECASIVADGLDLLHIDGCHSVLASCRDVEVWLPKMRAGGLIVLDDCEWSTVQPARAILRARCGAPVESPEVAWEAYFVK